MKWRDVLALILLAFLAGWLCKWLHGHTGHQTRLDTLVILGAAGCALMLAKHTPDSEGT